MTSKAPSNIAEKCINKKVNVVQLNNRVVEVIGLPVGLTESFTIDEGALLRQIGRAHV